MLCKQHRITRFVTKERANHFAASYLATTCISEFVIADENLFYNGFLIKKPSLLIITEWCDTTVCIPMQLYSQVR